MEIQFEPVANHSPGVIEALLTASYADLPASPEERERYRRQWRQADRDTFANLDTIGRCTFITCLDGEPIGFGSFDPRGTLERGVIGQNCIRPAYRGRGFGRRQLEEILRRLQALGIRMAVVTTGAQEFFLPARRMYEVCGFRQTGRSCGADGGCGTVQYEKELL